ncbi:MAG: BatD family protein, partial [Bacteroidales bacterium]|nr:BatD family protein [Bacteroidales bacterium]
FVSAQNIVVATNVPSVVTLGEQFRVTWTANTKGGSLIAPNFKDFLMLNGPQTSTSSNTTLSGNKITSVIKNSFTYYLQANKEGKFTLGAAKYIYKNKEYLSREVSIEVVAAEDQNATASQNQNKQEAITAGTNVSAQDLYVRLHVNRNRVVMGEHIVATLKIYSRVNLSGIQEVEFPDFNGFLKTDLETPALRTLERENVDGKIYNTGVLQRFLLYPQKTGTLEIEPSTLTVLLQQQVKSNDPFFGDFFSSYNTVPRAIATLPVKINIESLPANAPASFSGTVGHISLSSSTNMDTMKVNDALSYIIVLKGEGNLKLSSAPTVSLSPDIEVYEPKIVSDIKSNTNGTSGSKTFEYLLIPRHHGLFTIPELEYSYYNTDQEKYITLKAAEHKFYVRKSQEGNPDAQIYGAVTKEDITYLGKDIRYINTDVINLKLQSKKIVSRSSFMIIYLSAFLLFIIIILWRKEHLRRNADQAKVKNRKAAKVAAKRLKSVKEYLKESDNKEFYAELLRAMWGYLSDKLGLPIADINSDLVCERLKHEGISEETIEQLIYIIETCEFSRYSPQGEQDLSRDLINKAAYVIKIIEDEV